MKDRNRFESSDQRFHIMPSKHSIYASFISTRRLVKGYLGSQKYPELALLLVTLVCFMFTFTILGSNAPPSIPEWTTSYASVGIVDSTRLWVPIESAEDTVTVAWPTGELTKYERSEHTSWVEISEPYYYRKRKNPKQKLCLGVGSDSLNRIVICEDSVDKPVKFAEKSGISLALTVVPFTPVDHVLESIAFHMLSEFEHVYLYDLAQSPELKDAVQPLLKKGIVTYISWPISAKTTERGQGWFPSIIDHFLYRFAKDTEIIVFLGSNEFMLSSSPLRSSLFSLLKRNPVLVPEYSTFGPNGLSTVPSGYITQKYVKKTTVKSLPDDLSIVQAAVVLNTSIIVSVDTKSKYTFRSQDGSPLRPLKVPDDTIRVNYYIKSMEEYNLWRVFRTLPQLLSHESLDFVDQSSVDDVTARHDGLGKKMTELFK